MTANSKFWSHHKTCNTFAVVSVAIFSPTLLAFLNEKIARCVKSERTPGLRCSPHAALWNVIVAGRLPNYQLFFPLPSTFKTSAINISMIFFFKASENAYVRDFYHDHNYIHATLNSDRRSSAQVILNKDAVYKKHRLSCQTDE